MHMDRLTRFLAVLIIVSTFILTSLYCPEYVHAQASLEHKFEIPSSWNPVGSGARALGMGGAFIAVADDATAASWNPGGLTQLEKPEISVVGSYFHRREDYTFGSNPEASGLQSVSFTDLNYLSLAYPFSPANLNMIIALTYQNLFDFNREANFTLSQSDEFVSLNSKIHTRHKGNLSAIGLSYCISPISILSFGLTLNFWEDWMGNHGWKETIRVSDTGTIYDFPYADEYETKKYYSFSGFNVNLGFLWCVTPNLTAGGVIKTPFTADVEIKTTMTKTEDPPYAEAWEELDLKMPLSYGIGLSYRFSDAFTAALDLYRTEWQDFLWSRPSGKESPITGRPEAESDIDPTTQVRIGCEYLFIDPKYVIPLRGGIFYDPAPAPGSPDDFFGVSIGSGFVRGRFIFDIAYHLRWGNNVGSHLYRNFDFSSDLEEHTVYSSLIIHL